MTSLRQVVANTEPAWGGPWASAGLAFEARLRAATVVASPVP